MGRDGPFNVLGFEPYDGGSHRVVRRSISLRSRHRWTWCSLPPRAWKWRMRLGAIELLERARDAGVLDRPVDAIFATSLLSVADLRAALPARLRATPLLLYMHENQAAYPSDPAGPAPGERDVHFALTNLTSIIAADETIWNSAWNRRSFCEALDEILRHAPDRAAPARRAARLDDRPATILWPPVEPPPIDLDAGDRRERDRANRAAPTVIVWPHRWEHDKGPEELLALAERFTDAWNLRWIILGARFRRRPPALEELLRRFSDRVEFCGFEPDRTAYWRRLHAADWVLSTAVHEFFGIAVVEAMLAGCLPWLPDRLSYPEIVPPELHGLSPAAPPGDRAAARAALQEHLDPALAPNAVRQLDEIVTRLVVDGASPP